MIATRSPNQSSFGGTSPMSSSEIVGGFSEAIQAQSEDPSELPGVQNASRTFYRSSFRLKTAVDKIPEKLRLYRSNSKILDLNEETPPTNANNIYISPSLREFMPHLLNLQFLFADIDKRPHEWRDFVYQSLLSRIPPTEHARTFPLIPNAHDYVNDSFTPIELLTIVKYLRPSSVENFVKSLVGEVRNKKYFILPRTNFETHSSIYWHRRPTVLFFGSSAKNPTQYIEILAQRYNRVVYRISLGDSSQNLFEDLSRAASAGYWIVFENLNLLSKSTLTKLIKKIDEELEAETSSENLKIWITYYTDAASYSSLNLENSDSKQLLDSFLKTCLKLYYNRPDSIRFHLLDAYKDKFSEYFFQLEAERMNSDFKTPPRPTVQQNLQKYRAKMQTNLDIVDLHEFYERKLPKPEPHSTDGRKATMIIRPPSDNITDLLAFKLKYLFSVLKCRFRHERIWSVKSHKYCDTYITDNDISDTVDDLTKFLFSFKGNKQKFIEKYLIYYFNCSSLHFTTLSAPVIAHFIKGILRKADENDFIKVTFEFKLK